jgi:hypothetical protein
MARFSYVCYTFKFAAFLEASNENFLNETIVPPLPATR